MEVDPNKDVLTVDLNKDVEGMEIVPPPCNDIEVCILVAFAVDAMLPAVVIEGMFVCGLGLEGLCVGVPTYKNAFG